MPDAGPVAVADVDQDAVDYVAQVEDDVSQVAPVLEIGLTDVIDEEEACPSAEVVEAIDIDAAPVVDADQDAADYVAQVEDEVAPVPGIDVVDEEEASHSADVVEVMIDIAAAPVEDVVSDKDDVPDCRDVVPLDEEEESTSKDDEDVDTEDAVGEDGVALREADVAPSEDIVTLSEDDVPQVRVIPTLAIADVVKEEAVPSAEVAEVVEFVADEDAADTALEGVFVADDLAVEEVAVAPGKEFVDDSEEAVYASIGKVVDADVNNATAKQVIDTPAKPTLEKLLQLAKPEVKSVLKLYKKQASYLSNRATIQRRELVELKESADFLKRITGGDNIPKDKITLTHYIVDNLDLAAKRGLDKCQFHASLARTPGRACGQKKPVLQIRDSKHQYTKDRQCTQTSRDESPKTTKEKIPLNHAVNPLAEEANKGRTQNCKTSKSIKKDQIALEDAKNKKLVAKMLSRKREEVTERLLELASSEDSKNVILQYSILVEDAKNISALERYSYPKLPLQTTFKDVVGSEPCPDLTRKQLAKQIVERIKGMLPLFCRKCSDFYCRLDQDKTTVQCFHCETVAHKVCLDRETDRFDPDRGYVWLCHQCLLKPVTKQKKFRYMDAYAKKQCDKEIGLLLSKIKGKHAATTMVQSYSLELTDSYNVNMLMKNDKPMITRAYRTLMEVPDNQVLNKETIKSMVLDIVEVIKRRFPKLCGSCRETYSSAAEDTTSEVACQNCKTKGHKGCHSDRLADPDIGAVWLCTVCMEEVIGNGANLVTIDTLKNNPYYGVKPTVESTCKEVKPENTDTIQLEEVSPVSKLIKEEQLKVTPVNQQNTNLATVTAPTPALKTSEKSGEWCPKLLKGICPFGWTGNGCSYDHPRRCIKYCRFGSVRRNQNGCPYGERCRFFHPELCENAQNLRKCLILDCRKVHLVGTARPKKDGEKPVYSEAPFHHLEDKHLNRSCPKEKKQIPGHSDKLYTKPAFSDTISFLEMRLEGLKAYLMTIQGEVATLQDCLTTERQKQRIPQQIQGAHRNRMLQQFKNPPPQEPQKTHSKV